MNTDVLGLYWLQVRPFSFYHDISPCMNFNRWLTWTAWWMPLVEYDIKALFRTSFLVVFVLHELLFSIICFSFGLCAVCLTVCGFWLSLCLFSLIFTYYLVRIVCVVVPCMTIRLNQSKQAHSTTCLAFINCKYQVPYCIPCCNLQNMIMYVQWLFLYSVI